MPDEPDDDGGMPIEDIPHSVWLRMSDPIEDAPKPFSGQLDVFGGEVE